MKKALEKVNWRDFGPMVIGVDEVGRGCLAGPVGAAACLFGLPLSDYTLEKKLTDSKKLTPLSREKMSFEIAGTFPVCYAEASVDEIDQLNILQAAFLSMKRAVDALVMHPAIATQKIDLNLLPILIDGHLKSPHWVRERQFAIIKGDLLCAPISAASIYAKVQRDQKIIHLDKDYPGYELAAHKGYSTLLHKKLLIEKGPTPIHRKTFSGVKELI